MVNSLLIGDFYLSLTGFTVKTKYNKVICRICPVSAINIQEWFNWDQTDLLILTSNTLFVGIFCQLCVRFCEEANLLRHW